MLHPNRGGFGEEYPLEMFRLQKKNYTAVHELGYTKLKSDTVANKDYMIHDGD